MDGVGKFKRKAKSIGDLRPTETWTQQADSWSQFGNIKWRSFLTVFVAVYAA